MDCVCWHQSLRFDVAEIDNRIVAFQYSTRSDSRSAHLVRITVHPDVQGQGVGTALLNSAFTQLQHSGYRFISLNTQIGNLPSQTLYHKFSFGRPDNATPSGQDNCNSHRQNTKDISGDKAHEFQT